VTDSPRLRAVEDLPGPERPEGDWVTPLDQRAITSEQLSRAVAERHGLDHLDWGRLDVKVAVASVEDISALIARMNRFEEAVHEAVEESEDGAAPLEIVDLRESAEDAPVIKLVRTGQCSSPGPRVPVSRPRCTARCSS
jgi:hypothetical protein